MVCGRICAIWLNHLSALVFQLCGRRTYFKFSRKILRGTAPGAILPPPVQGFVGKRSQDRLGYKECPCRLRAVEIRRGLHH